MTKQKLELTWIGKEKRPQLEPRILLEDPAALCRLVWNLTSKAAVD
jgi:adenine-specific DNA-methyltransferase